MRALTGGILLATIVGCQCLEPVDEGRDAGPDAATDARNDGGQDAGDLCQYWSELTPGIRYDDENSASLPNHYRYYWRSPLARDGCVVYVFSFHLSLSALDLPPYLAADLWSTSGAAWLCNACDEPVVIETTYYGSLTDRLNWQLYFESDRKASIPTYAYEGADIGFGLRDSTGQTVPSSCVSRQDVWCSGHGWETGDAGSPTLHARRTELLPGESLEVWGLEHSGLIWQEVEGTSDPVVPVAPFEDWRGYLFDSTAPDARIDLDGRLDLVAFLPRAVKKSELASLKPSKPRDQACAWYGFPLIGSPCRDRLDVTGYGRDDFVEVVIPDVQLPDVLLDELRRRAAPSGADGGP